MAEGPNNLYDQPHAPRTAAERLSPQFDNAREFCGWGKSARYLTCVIRLCLSVRVTPIFIPQRRPQRGGAVENFDGLADG